uniref:Uncharacterized protein n=1 Tax=Romanomermis culicivorax TaxID=13658 RepID=A0A915IX92_ROMCU
MTLHDTSVTSRLDSDPNKKCRTFTRDLDVKQGVLKHFEEFQLMGNVNWGNGGLWFVAGYGTYTNRSSFYWYRNILGYPETVTTLDSFWADGQPNNMNGEFFLGVTCQSPWVAIDKLYYYLITTPFANVSSAMDGCKRMDPRATLPDFRDLTQWKASLDLIEKTSLGVSKCQLIHDHRLGIESIHWSTHQQMPDLKTMETISSTSVYTTMLIPQSATKSSSKIFETPTITMQGVTTPFIETTMKTSFSESTREYEKGHLILLSANEKMSALMTYQKIAHEESS